MVISVHSLQMFVYLVRRILRKFRLGLIPRGEVRWGGRRWFLLELLGRIGRSSGGFLFCCQAASSGVPFSFFVSHSSTPLKPLLFWMSTTIHSAPHTLFASVSSTPPFCPPSLSSSIHHTTKDLSHILLQISLTPHRALSEVISAPLPYDDTHQLRERMWDISPTLLRYDVLEPPSLQLAKVGLNLLSNTSSSTASNTPFKKPIRDFYRTDPISRASVTMAACSKAFTKKDYVPRAVDEGNAQVSFDLDRFGLVRGTLS